MIHCVEATWICSWRRLQRQRCISARLATMALEQALNLPVDIIAVQRGHPGSAFARMARGQAQPVEHVR